MTDISRREVLIGVAAAAIAASAPSSIPAILPAPAAEVIPAWAVGTPGEFNWQHVIARTAEQAESIFRAEWCSDSCEGEHDSPCGECGWCTLEVVAERKPIWDGKAETSSGDWLLADMGAICSRCGYETFAEEGGHAVGGEAVCSECMTLTDWDIVDPEHAAELREGTAS